MASLSNMGLVFTDPQLAFSRLKNDSSPWLPLLSILLLGAAVMYWWVATADFTWLRAHAAASNPEMNGEQRAAMNAFLTPSTMMWSTQLGMLFGTLATLLLSALYYLLAGRVLKTPFSYGKWFAFTCWTSLPRLLIYPLMALQIATGNGQVAVEGLNLASIAALLGLESDNPWIGLASSLDFTVVWSLVLSVIGLKIWTGRSTSTCTWVAVIPFAAIYGLWALKILLSS